MSKKRGQLIWDKLIPWIIGIAVLALAIFLLIILFKKGSGFLEYLKNLFRFGK